jgi:hypothetical protein
MNRFEKEELRKSKMFAWFIRFFEKRIAKLEVRLDKMKESLKIAESGKLEADARLSLYRGRD